MTFLSDRLKARRKEKERAQKRAEERAKKLEARRQWKATKPRPLLDLIKASSGLIKWLLIAGGAVYLFMHGNNHFQLFKK